MTRLGRCADPRRQRRRRGRAARRALAPLEPVGPRARWLLGVAFFVVFVAAVVVLHARRLRLADLPRQPADDGARKAWLLFTEYGFIHDIGMTVWRVVGGFVLAAVVAVPLGIAMGAYKPVEAFFEPFVSFCRYLPASAFIPLLILWAGIGEAQKLLVIFIGSVFQIIADGRGHRRRRAPRPGRGGLHAGRRQPRHRARAC